MTKRTIPTPTLICCAKEATNGAYAPLLKSAKQQYDFPAEASTHISWAVLASEFGMGSGVSQPLLPFDNDYSFPKIFIASFHPCTRRRAQFFVIMLLACPPPAELAGVLGQPLSAYVAQCDYVRHGHALSVLTSSPNTTSKSMLPPSSVLALARESGLSPCALAHSHWYLMYLSVIFVSGLIVLHSVM